MNKNRLFEICFFAFASLQCSANRDLSVDKALSESRKPYAADPFGLLGY